MRKRRPWTYDEDKALRVAHARGDTFKEIAAAIGTRTANSCISRANALGLYSRERSEQIHKGMVLRAIRVAAAKREQTATLTGRTNSSH